MPSPKEKPPGAHIEWVKYLREKIPGDTVRVHRHYDEGEQNAVAIFTSENEEGIVAATVGLMDYDQSHREGVTIPTEILVDARGRRDYVANVAATIAFFVMKDKWKVAPDVTFAEIIGMYAPDLAVRHVLFVPPFQWPDGMTRVVLRDRTIYPLLAVPITDGELELVRREGADALTDRWVRESTDVLDWSRAGVT